MSRRNFFYDYSDKQQTEQVLQIGKKTVENDLERIIYGTHQNHMTSGYIHISHWIFTPSKKKKK